MSSTHDDPTIPRPMDGTRGPGDATLRPLDSAILRPGLQVFGRYELSRLVGRGGMGVVWLAHDSKLNRPVALKFLPEVFFLDAAARDGLKRETRRSLDLTHPHIVRIHDFVEDEDMAAIAMEYVDGPTLSDLRVEQTSRYFEPDGLAMWTSALCAALEYAHGAGRCVHRDLKPGNLMVNSRGVLKVADFGIACNLHNTAARVSAWSSTGGTLGYMSPQQLLGELAAPSDDIYSVGATLYELLTGQPPFFSGDIALQIREVVPDTVTERRRKFGLPSAPLPKVWDETIAACLAKQPRDRPSSAAEIAHRLGLTTAGAIAEVAPRLHDNLAPTVCAATEVVRVSAAHRLWLRTQIMARPLAPYRWPIITVAAVAITAWISQMGADAPPSPPGTPSASIEIKAGPTGTPNAVPATTEPPRTIAIAKPPSPSAVVNSGSPPVPGLPPTSDQLALTAPIPAPPRQWTEPDPRSPSTSPESAPPKIGVQLDTTPAGVPFKIFATTNDSTLLEVLRSGETPDVLDGLTPGSYRIVFAPPGLPARAADLQVPAGGSAVFHQTFPYGVLKVRSQPDGATVICDDEEVGETPLELPILPGRHEVSARLNDREARVRIVQITDTAEQSLAFDFRAGNATTAAKSRPRRQKKTDDSVFTKVGRSIKTFFAGDKKR